MRYGQWTRCAASIALMSMLGCADAQSELPDDDAMHEGADGELVYRKGERGPEIEKANLFLSQFGYFPSAKLSSTFPGFRPVVTEAPGDSSLFDERTEQALRKFQALYGLEVSGTLNAETRDAMALPRCGNPDVDEAEKRVDKWALLPGSWNKTTIKVRFADLGSSLIAGETAAGCRAIIMNAVRVWEQVTNLTFVETTGAADLTITYANIDGAGGALAQANAPPNQFLNFDTSEKWDLATLQNAATHEAGHMIGLHHTSISNAFSKPMMWPAATGRTTLDDDDRIAANVRYNDWKLQPGLAIDIGVNSLAGLGYSTAESVWVLGTDKATYRWNGSNWTYVAGMTGTRLDVDNTGKAWVVTGSNKIYKYTNDAWTEVPGGGLAYDVGLGAKGDAWVIGLDRKAWRHNGAGWVYQGGPANQVAIDVDVVGLPWVLTSAGKLHRQGADGVWREITSGMGLDIGVGGNSTGLDTDNYPWLIGLDSAVWAYSNQSALGADPNAGGAPASDSWVRTNGIAARIAVAPRGAPWVVTSNGNIFRRLEL